MLIARRLSIVTVLTMLLLLSNTVQAAPELYSTTTSLQGALIPGGEVVFTALGTPACTATLTLSLTVSSSSSPLTWSSRMLEEEDGVYVYRWTVWESMDLTLNSATVQIRDGNGQQSSPRDILGGALSIGGEIRGRITDALTLSPLVGVRVMAYSPSTRHFALATTNQRGEYTLAGLGTAKDYRLWTVNDQGYAEAKKDRLTVNNGGSTTGVDLALSGRSAISGYVEDDSGSPLAGVIVTIERQDGADSTTTVSDENGRFMVGGLAPGAHNLLAQSGSVSAVASVEVAAGKVATVSFLLVPPRHFPSCQITFPDLTPELTSADQLAYWPRQGGPVRMEPLAADGTAVLHDLMTGEEWVLSPMVDGQPTTYYSFRASALGDHAPVIVADDSVADQDGESALSLAPALVTRGGSVLLSGRATGMKWVDLWLDGCWEARLPIHAGRWQTIINLDQGEHQITVMAAGSAAPRKVEQQIVVRRSAPAVLQLKVNQQPQPSFFSGDGGGEILVAPKQPLTVSLTTTQAGTTNWLVLGDRQWVMGKQGDIVTTTIPTDAMVEGEHPLTWRWERQGVRGEVPLGTVNVRKPTIWTVIDAITGEPVPGMNARVEQQASLGWEASPLSPHVTNDRGQVNLWLDDQTDYWLRLTKPGYQEKLIPIDPTSRRQETVIYLTPTRPSGPISISPGRDARDVDTTTMITVAFARDLAPKSVNSDTFYIQGINAKVSYDPLSRKATLEPIGRLADNSHYLVHLSGEIRYADGTPLGRGLWWLISTADQTSEEERSSVSKLTPVGQAATLAPKDSSAKAIIPAGSSPVQTLYRLTRPSTLPKALPGGWKAVAAPLNFAAINSPLDKPIHMLQQGAEISLFYTDPPAEGQTVTLWRYDNSAQSWVEHSYDHDLDLRTVRFATDRPGTFVLAKAN